MDFNLAASATASRQNPCEGLSPSGVRAPTRGTSNACEVYHDLILEQFLTVKQSISHG